MAEIPTLPVLADGVPPDAGVMTQWLAGLPAEVDEILIDPVPPVSAHLPDLLAAAGIRRVVTSAQAPTPRWRGPTGGTVVVNDHAGTGATASPWRGDLCPATGAASTVSDPERAHGQRLRQAAAASVIWPDGGPPAATADDFTAWNPLPLARRAVVAFPAAATRAPWVLRDPRSGARHPVQVVEGSLGPEWLASLPLAALEVARFTPEYEPVDGGAPWEVSEEILDNGLVRVELDLFGQIERLCFGGHFVPLAGHLLRAGIGEQLLATVPARCTVHEAGPVRARVGVTREFAGSVLHVTYTLFAFDPCLRVSVAWDGDQPQRWLDCATSLSAQPWQRSVGWHSERIEGNAQWHHGLSWVRLDDGDGGGLLVASPRPWSGAVDSGRLIVAAQPSLALVIGDPRRSDPTTVLDRWVVPAVAVGASADQRPLRWVAPPGVASLWLRRDTEGVQTVTLSEQAGRSARCWLYPAKAGQAWTTDVRGGHRRDLALTPEGDGIQIDLAAGALVHVHWRTA